MAYSLSLYEQEVVINFNAGEDTATIYTAMPKWIRKLDKLVEEHPENFEQYRQETMGGKVISKSYRCPKDLIRLASGRRTVSEEQRKAAAERFAAMAANKQKNYTLERRSSN